MSTIRRVVGFILTVILCLPAVAQPAKAASFPQIPDRNVVKVPSIDADDDVGVVIVPAAGFTYNSTSHVTLSTKVDYQYRVLSTSPKQTCSGCGYVFAEAHTAYYPGPGYEDLVAESRIINDYLHDNGRYIVHYPVGYVQRTSGDTLFNASANIVGHEADRYPEDGYSLLDYAEYERETCPVSSCGVQTNVAHWYSGHGSPKYHWSMTMYSKPRTLETYRFNQNAPVAIEGASISGYPSWLKSGDQGNQHLVFKNCTFTAPVPASLANDPKVHFENCKGYVTSGDVGFGSTPLDSQLVNRIFETASNLRGHTATQIIQGSSRVLNYTGDNAAGLDLNTLTITKNGAGLRYGQGTSIPSVNVSKSGPKHLWLTNFGDTFDFSGRTGSFIQDQKRGTDITLANNSGYYVLSTAGNITATNSDFQEAAPGVTKESYAARVDPKLTADGTLTLQNSSANMYTLTGSKGVAISGGTQTNTPEISSGVGNVSISGTTFNGNATTRVVAANGKLSLSSLNLSPAATLSISAKTISSGRLNLQGTVNLTTYSEPWNLSGWTLAKPMTFLNQSTVLPEGSKHEVSTSVIDKFVMQQGGTINAQQGAVILASCTANSRVSTLGSGEVVIDGGTYQGAPAVSGSNITVKRGTFTDTSKERMCQMKITLTLPLTLLALLPATIYILNKLICTIFDILDDRKWAQTPNHSEPTPDRAKKWVGWKKLQTHPSAFSHLKIVEILKVTEQTERPTILARGPPILGVKPLV